MPIKQVMCCKCSKLVNKAVTYSIAKDQRACKSHEGVVETRGQLELVRFQKIQASIASQKRRENKTPMWSGSPLTPKCWVCMNEGLRQDDYFYRALIELEKFRQTSPNASVLEMLKVRPAQRCIFVLTKEKCTEVMKYVRDDFKMNVEIGGILAICGPCCGTFKIEPLTSPSTDQLRAAMEVAAVIRPVIEETAKAELAKA